MAKKFEFICNRHQKIMSIADSLGKLKCGSFSSEEELIDYIRSEASLIYDEASKAFDSAIAMESRLSEYRTAIENLGFERIKEE